LLLKKDGVMISTVNQNRASDSKEKPTEVNSTNHAEVSMVELTEAMFQGEN
jgi:hypothetical protein